jgi:hypothetical protein
MLEKVFLFLPKKIITAIWDEELLELLWQISFHNSYLNFQDESNQSNYVIIRQRRATLIHLKWQIN